MEETSRRAIGARQYHMAKTSGTALVKDMLEIRIKRGFLPMTMRSEPNWTLKLPPPPSQKSLKQLCTSAKERILA